MSSKQLYIEGTIIGIGPNENFYYQSDRPARHCGICGESYQPHLARHLQYPTSAALQHEVEFRLKQWAIAHNARHSEKEKTEFVKSGQLMTPEAALKLIPLGIYPLADLVLNDEVEQAGQEAKRAPSDDIPDKF